MYNVEIFLNGIIRVKMVILCLTSLNATPLTMPIVSKFDLSGDQNHNIIDKRVLLCSLFKDASLGIKCMWRTFYGFT